MSKIYLRPMTEAEFEAWRVPNQENYAREKEKEGLSPEDARAVAEKSFRELLPAGPASPDQYVSLVVEAGSDQAVGAIWWGVQNHGSRRVAWVYSVDIDAVHRGKGYGRASMEAAEAEVRANGFDRFGLHVFGYNKVARNLYQSLGFDETNVVMYKDLK